MTQFERVPATRLRPGDVLFACEMVCEIHAVELSNERVLLSTNSRRFSVPKATHFKRPIRSRRINMRPDLGARHGTRGTGTQSPDLIARRIRTRRGAR